MFEGGCLCGAVRYRVSGTPLDAGYCHCLLCRRSTGAPVSAWLTFPIDSFEYTKGKTSIYRSSLWGQREFCSVCGTQIAYRDAEGARSIDISMGSLDDPTLYRPEYHIFVKDRIPWFDTADNLPRHENAGPDVN